MMVGNARRRVFLHVVLTGALGWPSPASCLSLPHPGRESRAAAFPRLPRREAGSYISVRCRRAGSSLGTAVRWFPSRYLEEEHRDTEGQWAPTSSFPRRRHGP